MPPTDFVLMWRSERELRRLLSWGHSLEDHMLGLLEKMNGDTGKQVC